MTTEDRSCERDGCGHSEGDHLWRGEHYMRGGCRARGCTCVAMLGPQSHLAVSLFDLTTEGSAEVPAGERNELLAWLDRLPAHEHLNWWDYFSDCRACTLVTERATTAAAERTRLEARLAEVEAERDRLLLDIEAQVTARIVNREEADALIAAIRLDEGRLIARTHEAKADLAALRAAVRPLVEAAEEADDYLLHMPFQTMTEAAIVSRIRAALADPAIAALLDQQKEQG